MASWKRRASSEDDSRSTSMTLASSSGSSNSIVEETITPWITSPMDAWNPKTQSFSPRHESSTLELFFDLFFVANLATFTQYHSITTSENFWSYFAFFVVLWTSWFQVTTFDVRFANDSVWERACKVVQFFSFASFALVGYKSDPSLISVEVERWVYQVCCWTLFVSRAWLGLQYMVTSIYAHLSDKRPEGVVLPTALNAGVFLITMPIYAGLSTSFDNTTASLAGYNAGLYITLFFEPVATIAISCIWRRVSFRRTHLNERLGLLGLIIIGEGVIGITKTMSDLMADGVYFEGYGLIFCTVLILLLVWQLYYDNLPKYRFRTIKQQIWAALHLPLHLSILGIVEGSRQIVLSQYVVRKTTIVIGQAQRACNASLEGSALYTSLNDTLDTLKLYDSYQGRAALPSIYSEMESLASQPDLCTPTSVANATEATYGLPSSFMDYLGLTSSGIASELDIALSGGSTPNLADNISSRRVVYTYYFSAILLLLCCLSWSAMLSEDGCYLARFRCVSKIARGLVITVCAALLGHGLSDERFFINYSRSPYILPTVVLLLWFVCVGDRASKFGYLRTMRKERAELEALEKKNMSTSRRSLGETLTLRGGPTREPSRAPSMDPSRNEQVPESAPELPPMPVASREDAV